MMRYDKNLVYCAFLQMFRIYTIRNFYGNAITLSFIGANRVSSHIRILIIIRAFLKDITQNSEQWPYKIMEHSELMCIPKRLVFKNRVKRKKMFKWIFAVGYIFLNHSHSGLEQLAACIKTQPLYYLGLHNPVASLFFIGRTLNHLLI